MSIWRPPQVDQEPETTVSRWVIFRAFFDGKSPTDHVVGWDGAGRVSSAIISKDIQNRTVVTKSGRVYKLEGRSGLNMDAVYVWDRWCAINKVQSEMNVSEEYVTEDEEVLSGLD